MLERAKLTRHLAAGKFVLIVALEADQGQRVAHEHGLDSLVEGRRTGKRWVHIYFKNPRLLIIVNHDIEAVYFEAVHARRRPTLRQTRTDVRLARYQRLDYRILDLGMHLLEVDALFLELRLESVQVPLRRKAVLIVRSFVCKILLLLLLLQLVVLVLNELARLLIDREVGQMDEFLR